jgi:hypothetical protein
MKQTIEQRIVTILNNENASAAEVAEIVCEAESAAQTADRAVAAERARAMDVERSPNVEAAHQAVAESVLARERLRAALAKLRMKLSEAQAAEAQERWLVEFNRVKQKRDEAAAAFRRYRELAQEIVHIFALAAEIDREIHHVNASAPYGVHQRLRWVENEARNVEFSRDRPSLAATVELRDWDNSGRMLWPQRHFGSLTVSDEASIKRGRPKLAVSFILGQTCDVACWHETDRSARSDDVRSSGYSGLSANGSPLPSLTRCGSQHAHAAIAQQH